MAEWDEAEGKLQQAEGDVMDDELRADEGEEEGAWSEVKERGEDAMDEGAERGEDLMDEGAERVDDLKDRF